MMACLSVLAVSLATATALDAQTVPAPAPPPTAAPENPAQPAQPAQPVFRTEEIDQMVAPIALYPDQLLAQILMAATYPLEVVQAERWLRDPANASLKGDELAAALEPQTWDPSVKSLVPFPQVLGMMNDKLDWTERLGDAFLAQEADVMASVQRLRKQAQDAGSLQSTEQQKVVTEGDSVVIQPANPQVVYVPSYNPSVVYGTWPYPAYPPVYYPPPPAYAPAASAFVSGLAFAGGVALIGSLSGWGDCDWHGGSVNINAARYNTINANNIQAGRATALSANATTWRHDPAHRHGVAYRDPATRQAYQQQAAAAASSRNFRGYDGSAGQGTGRGAAAASTQQRQTAAAAATNRGSAASSTQQRRTAAAATGARPAASGTSAPRRPSASASARQPSAFQGIGNGADVRAQAQRGRASRQSAMSAPRAGGGAARSGGGGARGGGGRGGRR